MRIARCLFCMAVLIVPVFAQPADEAESDREKRLRLIIEQVIAEAPNLRLSVNRAYVYAKAGHAMWTIDQTSARTHYQNAVGELVNAIQESSALKRNNSYANDLMTGQQIRPEILKLIGMRDAEYALQAMYRTRPPAVAVAMASQPNTGTKIGGNPANNIYIAQNEVNLEQSLLRMAAEQNPERAIALLKESLKKGISGETFNLLSRLYEKDPAAADDAVTMIVDKLISGKFTAGNQPDFQAISVANSLLNNFVQERPAAAKYVGSDPAQMRRLAESLIAYYLGSHQQNYGFYLVPLFKVAEKLVPGAVAQLKQLQSESSRRGGNEYHEDINKLLSGDLTTEQLLAAAGKFPLNARGRIYELAASKLTQQGNLAQARQIIEDNFTDEARDNALANINRNQIGQLQNQGNFAEAERLIDEVPESVRLSALINLASAVFMKNPEENRSHALALLAKARFTISDIPETANEMGQLMQVIAAYVDIDEHEAIRAYESMIPRINDIAEASVVVFAFQGNTAIRQGEMIIMNNSPYGFNFDLSILTTLADKNPDRAISLIDSFTRRETRIQMKLQLAERLAGSFTSTSRCR